jgi:L-2-hydroxyglutarate oxidase LhgO
VSLSFYSSTIQKVDKLKILDKSEKLKLTINMMEVVPAENIGVNGVIVRTQYIIIMSVTILSSLVKAFGYNGLWRFPDNKIYQIHIVCMLSSQT